MIAVVVLGGTVSATLKSPAGPAEVTTAGKLEQSEFRKIETVEFGSAVPVTVGVVLVDGDGGFVPISTGMDGVANVRPEEEER